MTLSYIRLCHFKYKTQKCAFIGKGQDVYRKRPKGIYLLPKTYIGLDQDVYRHHFREVNLVGT